MENKIVPFSRQQPAHGIWIPAINTGLIKMVQIKKDI
ncbi:hypothetical protein NIASO_00610 [Niabella soli DSM 19437]|uniref:Uncharacterized protein n=1 Tax=Niabella soli DSM 19437 TaxID=929713 RepID=W0F6N7_9BACT|nr:hypothetical protein NIASO_00610 [Niabella soli DSM 19437]